MSTHAEGDYQAVIAAPGFCLGVRCDEDEIRAIRFLALTAAVAPRNALAAEAARQLSAYLADAEYVFALPLRAAGTPFQRRVWQQIAAIPTHQTRSYGEVARLLHNAPRAVGQACGANPYPLVVPCHRVLASDGGLGGFARQNGGFLLDVKRWLLAHEGC
ncbi:methylated-DNA--[protein]-cysteine S-methyltransferase [Candidatus Accumulibacter aalborgensis]|nr:methylated-DNA--[protein]-cysteine S-methyltransferase [Candidatus Accumulibacter aalborgensis]